ncbi:MAG TPA: OB-fold domain-containing protein [Kofleriaceae bacterium]|nr:OB-fold domain-containing protein [Kofleriaceae bacterium]
MAGDDGALSAPYTLQYTYQRSTGPVIGRFLGGLRAGRIAGVRTATGRVLVPPLEYDPETGDATGDEVEVGPAGVVTTWSWVARPRRNAPLDRPFAWALIKLDGADTAMLHAVDAGSPEAMATGMRVYPRWRSDRTGSIRDIECFALQESQTQRAPQQPVALFPSPVRLDYTVTAGAHLSSFLRALAHKRVIGGRCPSCTKVYVPPRGGCPTCGVPTAGEVDVADTGTVTTFCVIRIPFEAAPFPPPYVAIAVLLDGASIPIFHLLRGVPPEQVRMGMRVRAAWVADAELAPTLTSIRWFEVTGEPDVAYEAIAEHL